MQHPCLAMLFILLTMANWAKAQIDMKKWSPIAPFDLTIEDNPAEPGAAAMYLFRHGEIRSDQYIEHAALKIFTEEGCAHATIRVKLHLNWASARVIYPNGTTVEFLPNDIFKGMVLSTDREKGDIFIFHFPNVIPGAVVEYKCSYYLRLHEETRFVWYFQEDIFIRDVSFDFPRKELKGYRWGMVDPFKQANIQSQEQDGWISIIARNLPGLTDEEYLPLVEVAKPHLIIYYINPTFCKTHDLDLNTSAGKQQLDKRFWKKVGQTTADWAEKFMKATTEVVQFNDKILTKGPNEGSPAKKIYKYLAANFRNTDYEQRSEEERAKTKKEKPFKINSTVSKVIKNGYGSPIDIMFLYVALLRCNGLDARPAFVCPRDLGLFTNWLLWSDQFSDPLVAIRTDRGYQWFDPSTPYCPYGYIPWEKQNAPAMVLGSGEGDFVITPLFPAEQNGTFRRLEYTIGNCRMQGNIAITFSGTRNIALKNNLDHAGETARQDFIKGYLESDNAGIKPMAYRFKNLRDPDRDLIVEVKFITPEIVSETDERLVITPCLLDGSLTCSFTQPLRRLPVDMSYPFLIEDEITIFAPAGYSSETLPKDIIMENDIGWYSLTFVNKGNAIICQRSFCQKKYFVSADQYEALQALYKTAREGDTTTVALRQADTKY